MFATSWKLSRFSKDKMYVTDTTPIVNSISVAAETPEVSVVISAYNVTAYIQEALDSVLAQDFPNLEIIVVNDGCPDTRALERALKPYRSHITYIKQPNGGVSAARNAGIKIAKGQWLAFLDADDVWLPNYLEEQLAVLRADPGIDMVFPNAFYFGKTALAGRTTMDLSPADGEITFKRVLSGEVTVGYCGLVRRELVLEVGLFDPELRGSEDYNLWLRILKAGGRIVAQKKPLYRYRRRDESLTADTPWMTDRILESLRKTEDALPMTQEEQAAIEKHRRKLRADLSWSKAQNALRTGEWPAAMHHFVELQRSRPTLKTWLTILLLRISPKWALSLFNWRRRRVEARLGVRQMQSSSET